MSCDEDNKSIDKLSYFNLSDMPCNNLENITIDNNTSKEFIYKFDEPTSKSEKPKFSYEYNITKKSDNDQFLLFIYNDFTGTKFSIGFDPSSGI